MRRELVMTRAQWDDVQASLLSDEKEAAMYALVGHAATPQRERVLVRELIHLREEDYLVREDDQIVIKPAVVNSIIGRCEQEGLGILLLHSHPFEEGDVWFSPVDDWGEARELRVFHDCGAPIVASLVLGQISIRARVWDFTHPDNPATRPVDTLVIIGDHLSRIPTVDAPPSQAPSAAAFHERQALAIGTEGQARLAATTLAIVGAGGTGSACAEMAARLGVGKLLLIDNDCLIRSNLSRVYGSTKKDVGRKKVQILRDWIKSISDADVEPHDTTVHAHAAILKEADFILCCTDTQVSRAVCNQIAYQYLIPLIDMGNRIHTREGRIDSASAQYTLVGPGHPCLDCYGMIDYEHVRAETLSPEEYAKQRAEGYVANLDDPEPSVITLNTLIASHAMTRLLDVIAHTGGPDARKFLYTYLDGDLRAAFTEPKTPCTCAHYVGRGDTTAVPTW